MTQIARSNQNIFGFAAINTDILEMTSGGYIPDILFLLEDCGRKSEQV